MAQPAVVASAPCVQFPICCDGCTVGAATGYVHYMLASLLPRECCNHSRLFHVGGLHWVPTQPDSSII